MKRREALKRVVVATTAAALMPSCVFDKKKKVDTGIHTDSFLSESQLETLASVTETLIPETDIGGAKSISAHVFVAKMVKDCYDNKAHNTFVVGLAHLNDIASQRFNVSFVKSSAAQRQEIMQDISVNKDKFSPELMEFYTVTKRHTVQAFMTSEYVMTKIKGYEFVPGRFNGCIELAKAS